MAIEPALEIKVPLGDQRGKYVLNNFFTILGYPFRFVSSWKNPKLKIQYGHSSKDCDIHIPDYKQKWSKSRIKVTYFSDMPVLYVGEKPRRLYENSKIGFDLVGSAFHLLTRQEENYSGYPDANFKAYNSILYELGIQTKPILNFYIEVLDHIVKEKLDQKGKYMGKVRLWKNGKDFAVILSHDVDLVTFQRFNHVPYLFTRALSRDLSRKTRFESLVRGIDQIVKILRLSRNKARAMKYFEELLDIEEQFGLRSTFYFASLTNFNLVEMINGRTALDPLYKLESKVNFRNQRITVKRLIQILDSEGWEIGLHGSLQSYKHINHLQTEKRELEKCLGKSVVGVRQHYLALKSNATWKMQQEVGFLYDSTLGYNERLGHRAGIAYPFWIYFPGGSQNTDLIELPLSIHDTVLVDKEPSSIASAVERCIRRINDVRKTHGLVTLLWHPLRSDEKKLRKSLNIYKRILKFLNNQNVYIGTASDITNWWLRRSNKVKLEEKNE